MGELRGEDEGPWRPVSVAAVPGGAPVPGGPPAPPDPLTDGIRRLRLLLLALGETAGRADRVAVAAELARAYARFEDTVERAVEPLVSSAIPAADRRSLARQRAELRRRMQAVQRRTRRLSTQAAAAGDPAFGRQLEELGTLAARHLARLEDDVLPVHLAVTEGACRCNDEPVPTSRP